MKTAHTPKITTEGHATFLRWGNLRQYLAGSIDGLPMEQIEALQGKLEGSDPMPREDIEMEIDAFIDEGPANWEPIYWDWEELRAEES